MVDDAISLAVAAESDNSETWLSDSEIEALYDEWAEAELSGDEDEVLRVEEKMREAGVEFPADSEIAEMPDEVEESSDLAERIFYAVLVAGGFLIVGLIAIFRPESVWKVIERWKSDGPHGPSDSYIKAVRFNGVVSLIGALVFLVLIMVIE